MTESHIKEKEGELLNLIEQLSLGLEWRKFQTRRVKVVVGDAFQEVDRSGYPPFISFRFKNEDPYLVDRLKKAIEGYKGKLEWVMIAHEREGLPKKNWIICPKVLWEVRSAALELGLSPGEYMEARNPGFGPIAYDDLSDLTQYMQCNFIG